MHAHYWLSGVAGLHVASFLRAPLVLTLHTSAAAKNLRAGSDESPEPAEREAATALVLDAMSHAFSLRVPLEVNLSFGKTWADAKD